MNSFNEILADKVNQVENIISKYYPQETGYQKTVLEAMNYSIKAGGKRLRPMLMLEAYRLFKGEGNLVEPFMAAIEMIHTYSLVHDDLPAMDNDEYRRGMKTTHVVYGEGMAVLAGDALLNYAYETALKAYDIEKSDNIIPALRVLSDKAGIFGMVGGQAVDVEAEKKELVLREEELMFIHEKKTSALIQASLMVGAILAGASQADVSKMELVGKYLGLAFQIQDDILDVTGTLQELGKPIGSDEKNNKVTYVTLNGLQKAKQDVEELSMKAVSLINEFDGEKTFLQDLFVYMISRKK